MGWCFAIVNNRLAEIYFGGPKGRTKIIGHCYVDPSEFKTKKDQRWIAEDTAKFQFSYRKEQYKRRDRNR